MITPAQRVCYVRHAVHKALWEELGVVNGDEIDTMDAVSFSKRRPLAECQDSTTVCEFATAFDSVITTAEKMRADRSSVSYTLTWSNSPNEGFCVNCEWSEGGASRVLSLNDDDRFDHVAKNHQRDLMDALEKTTIALKEYHEMTMQLLQREDEETDALKEKHQAAVATWREQKALDPGLWVKKAVRRGVPWEHVAEGVDIVVASDGDGDGVKLWCWGAGEVGTGGVLRPALSAPKRSRLGFRDEPHCADPPQFARSFSTVRELLAAGGREPPAEAVQMVKGWVQRASASSKRYSLEQHALRRAEDGVVAEFLAERFGCKSLRKQLEVQSICRAKASKAQSLERLRHEVSRLDLHEKHVAVALDHARRVEQVAEAPGPVRRGDLASAQEAFRRARSLLAFPEELRERLREVKEKLSRLKLGRAEAVQTSEADVEAVLEAVKRRGYAVGLQPRHGEVLPEGHRLCEDQGCKFATTLQKAVRMLGDKARTGVIRTHGPLTDEKLNGSVLGALKEPDEHCYEHHYPSLAAACRFAYSDLKLRAEAKVRSFERERAALEAEKVALEHRADEAEADMMRLERLEQRLEDYAEALAAAREEREGAPKPDPELVEFHEAVARQTQERKVRDLAAVPPCEADGGGEGEDAGEAAEVRCDVRQVHREAVGACDAAEREQRAQRREELREKLAALEGQQRALALRDTEVLRFEERHLALALRSVAEKERVSALVGRSVPPGEVSCDDHFVFTCGAADPLAVPIEASAPAARAREVNEIAAVRDLMADHRRWLLECKALREELTAAEPSGTDVSSRADALRAAQRSLFRQDYGLAGFDQFDDGVECDLLDTFVASVVAEVHSEVHPPLRGWDAERLFAACHKYGAPCAPPAWRLPQGPLQPKDASASPWLAQRRVPRRRGRKALRANPALLGEGGGAGAASGRGREGCAGSGAFQASRDVLPGVPPEARRKAFPPRSCSWSQSMTVRCSLSWRGHASLRASKVVWRQWGSGRCSRR